MLDLVSIEEKVSNTVQVPEYPYGNEKTETVMDAVGNVEVPAEAETNAEEYVEDKYL